MIWICWDSSWLFSGSLSYLKVTPHRLFRGKRSFLGCSSKIAFRKLSELSSTLFLFVPKAILGFTFRTRERKGSSPRASKIRARGVW